MILLNAPAAWTPDKDWLAVKPTACPPCRGSGGTCILIHDGSVHSREKCSGAQWRDCSACTGTGVLPITVGERVGLVQSFRLPGPGVPDAISPERLKAGRDYAVTHSAVVAEVLPTLPTDDFRTGRFVEHRDGYTWLYDGLHFVNITNNIVGDLTPGNLAVRITDVATVEDRCVRCFLKPGHTHWDHDIGAYDPIPIPAPPEGVDYWPWTP